MSTSCGSPCYAAPELVVQEGKYVGTAVDVWSCGVILYAMLAGYLPYDDDPANPEGDNINLLYKYIINTPLSFPDWISGEPRDLLLRMLVPEPRMRCTIDEVTAHPWLRKYAPIFNKSVEELEMMAQEAELTKRQMLEAQRQFLQQQQQAIQQAAASGMTQAQAIAMVRSQSTSGVAGAGGAAGRHRSAMITSSIPFPTPPSAPSVTTRSQTSASLAMEEKENIIPLIPPFQPRSSSSSVTSSQRKRQSISIQTAPVSPTIQSHHVTVDASPFSYVTRSPEIPISTPMSPSISAPPNPPPVLDDSMIIDSPPALPLPQLPTPASTPVPATETEVKTTRRQSARLSAAHSLSTTGLDAILTGTMPVLDEEEQKRKRANRATVQVEYDGGAGRIRESMVPTISEQLNAPEDVEMASSDRDDSNSMNIDRKLHLVPPRVI